MRNALIIAGVIVIGVAMLALSLIGIFNARKHFSYKTKTHNIEVITANFAVKLLVDGEEKDKMLFGSYKWFNATLTTVIDEGTIVARIKRKNLFCRPELDITLNNKPFDFISQK